LIDVSSLPWLAAVSWIIYGVAHSFLASNRTKNRIAKKWPTFTPYYRMVYNTLAVLLLLIPFTISIMDQRPPLWTWRTPLDWFAHSAAMLAVIGFIWSLKFYDMREFAGLPVENSQSAFDIAKLRISPLHRFVRHPWYFFMLVIIWTREMNQTQLVSVVVITLYLIMGSRLEENKLIAQFGDGYRNYRSKVNGLIPLPWKILSKEEQTKANG
jgi:protein-S-isoprenylcysteine O-methyltransferase Ste14